MRVGRKETLAVLESVSSGLSDREIIEQSNCFIFKDNRVCAFNDEVFCSMKSPWKGFEGAVKAKPLLDLLSKLPEDELDIEQVESEIQVKGKRKRSGIKMEQDILIPLDSVEEPGEWKSLPEDFSEAVDIVHSCASNLESEFVFTCVHMTPKFLEATDRFQIARYPLEMDLQEPQLVRAVSLHSVVGLGVRSFSLGKSWIHFKDETGLVLSIRKYLEDYHNLDAFLDSEGLGKVNLPVGIDGIVSRVSIFSSDNALGDRITVTLQSERITLEGEGASGWHKEVNAVNYKGEPIKFNISPKLLVELSKRGNESKVGSGKMIVDTGKFCYATYTEVPKE